MTSPSGDSIGIFVRCRAQEGKKALSADPATGVITLVTPASSDDRKFTFDYVGSEETGQEEVFDSVGRPLSDACLAGYNATVFAYGQTGVCLPHAHGRPRVHGQPAGRRGAHRVAQPPPCTPHRRLHHSGRSPCPLPLPLFLRLWGQP